MMRLDESLFETIDVIDEFAPYSVIAHEINLSTNRYNKRRVAKRDTLEAAEELAKIVAERISDVQARNYVSIVDNDGEEVDTISGPYNSDMNPNIDDLIEALTEEVVIKPIDNSYHDVWYLNDRYAVHNDGGRFHVIDRANGNNYMLNSDSIDEVNDYIKNNLNLDMSIEPSSRQFKKKANIDINKDDYLRDAAKISWESGHSYDPDDFSYFKRVCKEDGYVVNEEDFQKYWEYFDECRANQFADEDDIDLGDWEEMESKQVEDSDGFMTDYTWYVKDNDDGSETHVMIFGDQDLYTPMNSEPDAEFDSEDLAREWFDNYKGFAEDLEESVLMENSEDEITMRDVVKQIVDRFGNYKYQYKLEAEEYSRYGSQSIYNKKFLAPNNYLALFSMYIHKAPTIANLEEYFDPDELLELFEENPTFNDLYDYAQSVWWGDGDDFIISVDNLTTGENLYAAEYEDLSYNDDDSDYDFDDEELDEAFISEAELVNGYKVFKADSTNTWFVMDGQDYHNESEFEGKGYPTKEQAIERANSLEKGTATDLDENYHKDSFGQSNWYENVDDVMHDYEKGWLTKARAIEICEEEGWEFYDDLDESLDSEDEIYNGYVVRKSDTSDNYFVYDNNGHVEDAEHKGQGYPTKEAAIERANSLEKGIAKSNSDLEEAIKPDEPDTEDGDLSEAVYISKEKMANLDKEVTDAAADVSQYKLILRRKSDGTTEPDYSHLPKDLLDAAKKAYDRYIKALESRPDRLKHEITFTEAIEPDLESEELQALAKKYNIKILDAMSNGDLRMEGAGADLMKFYQEAEKLGLWEVDPSLYESKATGARGRYQVEIFDEGDWHKLNSWSTIDKAVKAGEAAVEAVYQDYRIIDKESGEPIELEENLTMHNSDEFKAIAAEVGLVTAEDLERFRKEEVQPGESELEAIKRYQDEINALNISEAALQDMPKLEGAMKDLAFEVKEAGGEKSWVDLANKELAEMKDSLHYLKTYAPKEVGAGGNYDSTKELQDDITEIEAAIKKLEAKLSYITSKDSSN